MKIQTVLKLAALTALFAVSQAHAQTSDSTNLPWTAATSSRIPFVNPGTYRYVLGNVGFSSYAACASNEVIVSGGGIVEDGSGNLCPWNRYLGYLHTSAASGNGWLANAFGRLHYGDTCVQAFALCARIN